MRVLLIELMDPKDGVEECAALAASLQVMSRGVDGRKSRHLTIDLVRPPTKQAFFRALQSRGEFIHVSGHGYDGDDDHTEIKVGDVYVTANELGHLDISATAVFLNVCDGFDPALERAFGRASTKRPFYFIAPKGQVLYHDALIVALLAIRQFAFQGRTPARALTDARRFPGIESDYWWRRWS